MRRRQTLILIFIFSTTVLLYLILPHLLLKENKSDLLLSQGGSSNSGVGAKNAKQQFTIAVVACGQRLQDTLMMIKSALLFKQATDFLHIVVFSDESLKSQFHEKLTDWTVLLPNEFNFEIHSLEFPKTQEKEWRRLFKPCASQRLFLPSLLQSIDSLLYVDTDTLFLSPISDIWQFFNKFNSTQIAALTPEHENENAGWYNRFARHPYYGRLGLNSGVMLMNLTRMRNFHWEEQVDEIYSKYKLKLTWGDQDIINIIFYFHPDKLFLMNCSYNYRPDHCMHESVCNVSNGVKVMHGNRGYFQSRKQPLFRCIYEAIERYQLNTDPYTEFLLPLKADLKDPEVKNSKCGVVAGSSLKIANQLFASDIYNDEEKDTNV